VIDIVDTKENEEMSGVVDSGETLYIELYKFHKSSKSGDDYLKFLVAFKRVISLGEGIHWEDVIDVVEKVTQGKPYIKKDTVPDIETLTKMFSDMLGKLDTIHEYVINSFGSLEIKSIKP